MTASLPDVFETAFADLLQQQELGAGVMVRCWHRLDSDYRWRPDADRMLPCVDLRCSAPAVNDDQCTETVRLDIMAASHVADDPSHAQINHLQDAVQQAIDALWRGFRYGNVSAWGDYQQAVAGVATLQGLRMDTPAAPYQDENLNAVGWALLFQVARCFNSEN